MFHGGADVTAVERVCAADIDLLGALVDKSLLVLGNGRYRMLETIREYGLERLAEAGETEWMRRALAGYLLDLAAEAEPRLRTAEQLRWLRRLGAEHDNLHAAVRGAVEAGDARIAIGLTARLGWYWWLSGHRAEGLALTRDALELAGDSDPEEQALAYTFAALNGIEGTAPMDDVLGWFAEAERLTAGLQTGHPALRLIDPLATVFRQGWEAFSFTHLAVLFDDPDPWLRAVSRMMSAAMRLNFGHAPELAEAEMRAALEGFQAIGERWGIGFALSSLGDLVAARGDFAQAVRWQREAIALVREVGLREDLPQLEVKLANQIWMAGDHDEARRMLKQARASAEGVELPEVTASIEYGHATLARADGDLAEARRRMQVASRRARRRGRRTAVPGDDRIHPGAGRGRGRRSGRGAPAARAGDPDRGGFERRPGGRADPGRRRRSGAAGGRPGASGPAVRRVDRASADRWTARCRTWSGSSAKPGPRWATRASRRRTTRDCR